MEIGIIVILIGIEKILINEELGMMMKQIDIDDNISMRQLEVDDAYMYYTYGLEDIDEEARYFTGTTTRFTWEQINSYVVKITGDSTRQDFLITENDKIIGEVVLSDINEIKCHFRICIFKKENFSRGIGSKVTKRILKYAFDELGLKDIELEVYPFNTRGLALYNKIGFNIVDRLIDEDSEELYRNIIVMNLNIKNYRSE